MMFPRPRLPIPSSCCRAPPGQALIVSPWTVSQAALGTRFLIMPKPCPWQTPTDEGLTSSA